MHGNTNQENDLQKMKKVSSEGEVVGFRSVVNNNESNNNNKDENNNEKNTESYNDKSQTVDKEDDVTFSKSDVNESSEKQAANIVQPNTITSKIENNIKPVEKVPNTEIIHQVTQSSEETKQQTKTQFPDTLQQQQNIVTQTTTPFSENISKLTSDPQPTPANQITPTLSHKKIKVPRSKSIKESPNST